MKRAFAILQAAAVRRGRTILMVGFLTAGSRDVGANLVINEVLYDPAGPDENREFIELMNTGPYAVTLEGISLETGNGSRPGDWTEAWRGGSEHAVPPGGVYRIGSTGPGRGEPADLKIQNADEGVRLLKGGFELDRVGWGAPVSSEFYEGRPAQRVRSGESLARRRDGEDSDDNESDFEAARPSPGRPNRPDTDWAVILDRPVPEIAAPGEEIGFRLGLVNRGVLASTPPAVEIVADDLSIVAGFGDDLAGQEIARETLYLQAGPDTGCLAITARIRASDPIPENDVDTLRVRIGRAEVAISEILSCPDWGGEWVEIAVEGNRAPAGLFFEAHGRRVRLADRAPGGSGDLLILAQDSLAFRARHPNVPREQLWSYEGTWPVLRDGDRRTAVADTLRLIDDGGLVLEWGLPGPAPSPGVSLVRWRRDAPEGPGMWIPCPDSSGSTPGRRDDGIAASGSGLSVDPRVIRAGSTPCRIAAALGLRPTTARLDILDLRGRAIRCLMRDVRIVGRVVAEWDARDDFGDPVSPGVYIAVLSIDDPSGEDERLRAAIAVAPAGDP